MSNFPRLENTCSKVSTPRAKPEEVARVPKDAGFKGLNTLRPRGETFFSEFYSNVKE